MGLHSLLLISSAIGGHAEHGPVRGDGGDDPVLVATAQETELGPWMNGVHVEGLSRWLSSNEGAPPVGDDHQGLDVVSELAGDLNDELVVEQLNLMDVVAYVAHNW